MTAIVVPIGDAGALAARVRALLPGCKVGIYYGDPGGGIVRITRPGSEPEFLLRGTRFVLEGDGTWRIEATPEAEVTS